MNASQGLLAGRRGPAAAAAALAALVVVAFAPVLGADFLRWDDDRFVTDNPLYQAGGWAYVRAAFTREQFDAYQPLHLLSYLPDRYLWPGSAVGAHALNLALHVAAVLLLFRLARRHASLRAAALLAALFAVHPLCVEPVAWVTARKDLLALLFVVGTLTIEDDPRRTGATPAWAAVALGAAALLTKTSAIGLPILVFAHLRWLRGRPVRVALVRAAPYAALAAAAAVAVHGFWSGAGLIVARPAHPVIDVLATLGTYLRRVVVPHDLAALHPRALAGATVVAAVTAAALIAIAVGWRRLAPAARFAVVAVLGALAPVANLVSMSWVADRYVFLALAMLVVPGARGLDALCARAGARRAPLVVGAAVVAIGAAAALTFTASRRWRDTRALFAHAAEVHPGGFYVRLKYGEALRDAGAWEPALREYQAAMQLRPDSPLPLVGVLYLHARRAERAGELARGTADAWLAALGGALAEPSGAAFGQLGREIVATRCVGCQLALVALGVRRWRQPDAALLAQATRALELDRPDLALVYLGALDDPAAPAAAALAARARQPDR